MGFVNEYISDEDIEKYELRSYQKSNWQLEGSDWTIDRDRDIYLRHVYSSYDRDEGPTGDQTWVLGWHKIPVIFRAIYAKENNPQTGEKDIYWTITHIEWPREFDAKHQEVLGILKEAFTAYGYSGIYATRPAPKTITLVLSEQ